MLVSPLKIGSLSSQDNILENCGPNISSWETLVQSLPNFSIRKICKIRVKLCHLLCYLLDLGPICIVPSSCFHDLKFCECSFTSLSVIKFHFPSFFMNFFIIFFYSIDICYFTTSIILLKGKLLYLWRNSLETIHITL